MPNAISDVRPTATGDRRNHLEFVRSSSPAMKAMDQAILSVASSSVPVLIMGESGTGKRMLAARLHASSRRKQEKFEEVICRDLTAEALALIMAGSNGRPTVGTLLMTEVGELPSTCQAMLLNLLVEREGPGSTGPRLVVSTRCNLEHETREGRFREDLYYRLAGICLRIPPLRHRREDIPGLADFFLRKYSALFGRPEPVLSEATRHFLAAYPWPGNVSELETAVKTIAAVGNDRIALTALRSSMDASVKPYEEGTSLKDAARAASRQAERELILRVLSRTRWNRKRAAEELCISYKALLYKLKQIGMDDYTKSVVPGEEV